MSSYMVIQVSHEDQDKMQEYETRTLQLVERHGGRPIARDLDPLALERDYTPRVAVILEFPTRQDQQAFYNSEEYAPLKEFRQGFARAEAVVIDGF